MGAVNKDQLNNMSNDIFIKILLRSFGNVYLSSVVKNRYGIELMNQEYLMDSYLKQQGAAKNLNPVESAKVGKIRFWDQFQNLNTQSFLHMSA